METGLADQGLPFGAACSQAGRDIIGRTDVSDNCEAYTTDPAWFTALNPPTPEPLERRTRMLLSAMVTAVRYAAPWLIIVASGVWLYNLYIFAAS